MKEFLLPINKPLRNGVRPEQRAFRSNDHLEALDNMVASPYGAVSPSVLTRVLTAGLSVAHPFPQLFHLTETTLLADQASISTVNTGTWVKTALSLAQGTSSDGTSITTGGPWHVMDFGQSWMLTNGACVVWNMNDQAVLEGMAQNTHVSNQIDINTMTAFRGRAVYAGFNPAKFWTSDWEGFWEGLADDVSKSSESSVDHNLKHELTMKSNFVMWSSAGGGNMLTPWLYSKAKTGYSDHSAYSLDASRDLVLDWMKRNDSGWMPVPWQGQVYKSLPLGDNCILYGENGISAIYPISVGDTPTMGQRSIAEFGIASRGAAGGDKYGHVFIDESGRLWALGPDLKLQLLDYQNIFSDMLGNEILIERNAAREEFYIFDGTETWALNKNGLSKISPNITSAQFVNGGTAIISAAEPSTDVSLITSSVDMNITQEKTITQVEVHSQNITSVQVRLHYKHKGSDSWLQTEYITVNDWDCAYFTQIGVLFKIEVKGVDGGNANIDQVVIKYKTHDRRMTRGKFNPSAS
tara:strand:+ start:962 stop:2530 length:1569 start_codon:yes stop_codon:yes gene_type:complete